MPSQFTHALIAEEILAALPENIRAQAASLPEYYAGAQGGDVFFFLRLTADPAKNPGKRLHRRDVYKTFCMLLSAARAGGAAVRSYAAGYITHYAADTVFHPFVYGTMEKLYAAAEQGEKRLLRTNVHSYIESDLDTHFTRTRKNLPVSGYTPPAHAPQARALHPALAEVCGGASLRAFARSFRRFALYERFFRDRTYRKRKFFYAAERLTFAPHILSVQCRRREADPRCTNAERALWRNPSVPAFTSHESADELFARAVAEGVRLVCAFFIALEGNGSLSRADFGKDFLTGAEEGVPLVRPRRAKRGKRRAASPEPPCGE